MDAVAPAVTTMVAEYGTESVLIIGAALGVLAIIWGTPKLIALFKKVA